MLVSIMTISRTIDRDLKLIINRYSGVISFDMFLDHMQNFGTMIEPELRCLVIFEDDTDFSQVSGDDLIALASKSPLLSKQIYTVNIASDSLTFGLSRLFSSYGSSDNMKIVKTLEEGCELLNISVDDFIHSHNKQKCKPNSAN